MKISTIIAIVLMPIASLTAAFLAAKTPEARVAAHNAPVWTETGWPYPIDQWGTGRAFRCRAADCGDELLLYLRAKVGFCNCATGVADDEELDRVSDVDLVGGQTSALGSGHPISVQTMKGRSRTYALVRHGRPARPVLSFAFNDRCDVIVATAVVDGIWSSTQQATVLEFLNGDIVRRWAESTMGL